MKKIFCILLVFSLFVSFSFPSTAVASYSAYAYWSTATNSIGFIGGNISSNFGYSRISGFKPPADLQSDFYKNGYYSNSMALFSGTTTGTATFDLLGQETVESWVFNPSDLSHTPASAGLQQSNVTMTSDGAQIKGVSTQNYIKLITASASILETVLCQPTAYDSTNYQTRIVNLYKNSENVHKIVSLGIFDDLSLRYANTSPTANYFNGAKTTSTDYKEIAQLAAGIFYRIKLVCYDTYADVFLDGVHISSVPVFDYVSSPANVWEPAVRVRESSQVITLCKQFSLYRAVLPTSTIQVNLSKSITISAGNDFEFYMNMRSGSVTNVTQGSTADFLFDGLSQISWIFSDDVTMSPISASGYWLYCKLPAADRDRTLSSLYFTFSTPYVNMNTGDEIRWDMALTLSDVVIGKSADIGYNPDVDPGENQFRDEVIGGLDKIESELGDVNDNLESIEDILNTPPDLDEFEGIKDVVNGIYDEMDRYVFDKYPNFPPIPVAPSPEFVDRIWSMVDEVGMIGIPLQSKNLNWLTFNSDDNVFRLKHYILWYTTIFLTRAFVYAISEASKAKNNPIQGDGDD